MISCRVRPEFSDDWTEVSFEGVDAESVRNVLLSRLDVLGYEILTSDEEDEEFVSPFEDPEDA